MPDPQSLSERDHDAEPDRLVRMVSELHQQVSRLADELARRRPAQANTVSTDDSRVARQQEAARALAKVKELFELDPADLGRVFGASRPTVTSWLKRGVPTARKPKLFTILNIGELLERKLKPGRLPAVARRPASAYSGLSMLQMMEADRHEELLESVRASFDWAATA